MLVLFMLCVYGSQYVCFAGTMRTSDDYIDANVRLALSAAGMVSR